MLYLYVEIAQIKLVSHPLKLITNNSRVKIDIVRKTTTPK